MIDTHCHLTFPDYENRIDSVLQAARDVGVSGCITISTTTTDCRSALRIAQSHERVWCSSGVHPLYSDREPHVWENLIEVARDPKCVAWGELGLDNHYNKPARAIQDRVLAAQLAHIESWNREVDLPVVLHCREAFDDLIPVLRASSLDPARFVFHCFTGNAADARKVLDFGAMISFTGVVTYHNAPEVREAAKLVPLDRMMIETDAPFLTPAPHRGVRPNEPKFVKHVAEALAELHGIGFEMLHAKLNENTKRFFGIDAF